MKTDKPIRVSKEAYTWLMKNRGDGSVKKKVDELITKYKEVEQAKR